MEQDDKENHSRVNGENVETHNVQRQHLAVCMALKHFKNLCLRRTFN